MSNWVFDLGVSDGQDTAFYLAKGFSVVGVEADPAMYAQMLSRFAPEINAGRLHLLNRAASMKAGEQIDIHVHQVHQAISGISLRPELGEYLHHKVTTIDWMTLCDAYPLPRYMKIDIEGSESAFWRECVPMRSGLSLYRWRPIEWSRSSHFLSSVIGASR